MITSIMAKVDESPPDIDIEWKHWKPLDSVAPGQPIWELRLIDEIHNATFHMEEPSQIEVGFARDLLVLVTLFNALMAIEPHARYVAIEHYDYGWRVSYQGRHTTQPTLQEALIELARQIEEAKQDG